ISSSLWFCFFFFFFFAVYFFTNVHAAGCPERVFLGCVLRLRAHRVPFERNILAVVFKVDSEAKLKRTCSSYSNIMPCFRDKINDCGDDKQRRLLNEVGKMIMFLCSPFSLDRQRRLLRYSGCIGDILKRPATTGCDLSDYHYGKQFLDCRRFCSTRPTDFICMMKTWISEQNICTVREIEKRCSKDAANFYVDMQTIVFEPLFPVICEYDG
ncbi:unnamed protein product, partial [Enterobius vermicularis]|uniref:Secreted protein n=1 Tax=Enterobius vermicularis TaxID=51028 RepID=A0A0N4V4X8_ENTVE